MGGAAPGGRAPQFPLRIEENRNRVGDVEKAAFLCFHDVFVLAERTETCIFSGVARAGERPGRSEQLGQGALHQHPLGRGKAERAQKEIFDSFQNQFKNFSLMTGKFPIPIKYRNCYFFSVSYQVSQVRDPPGS